MSGINGTCNEVHTIGRAKETDVSISHEDFVVAKSSDFISRGPRSVWVTNNWKSDELNRGIGGQDRKDVPVEDVAVVAFEGGADVVVEPISEEQLDSDVCAGDEVGVPCGLDRKGVSCADVGRPNDNSRNSIGNFGNFTKNG